jgi:cobalamin biosynthesis protein CobT
MAGSEQVFKRRWETEGLDTAVSILIDGSSSMTSRGGSYCGSSNKETRIEVCGVLALELARICENARVPVEVTVFQNTTEQGHDRRQYVGGMLGLNGMGAATSVSMAEPADLLVVKNFEQRMHQRVDAFKMVGYAAHGGTPDYAALYSIVRDMASRPEKRRIVLVLTDGMGDIDSVENLCKVAEKLDVTVIGFGIQSDCSGAYPNSVEVPSLSEMNVEVLGKLARELSKQGERRVM